MKFKQEILNLEQKKRIVIIGLGISCCLFNMSLCIQSLRFTSAQWSNTPRKKFTPIYEARRARHFMKRIKHVSTPNS